MAFYRITYFFESHQDAAKGAGSSLGWTESWYYSASGDLDSVLTNTTQVQRYVDLRMAILAGCYRCSFIRVNDDANPRTFKIMALDNKLGALFDAHDQTQVQCALLVDFQRMPRDTTHHEHSHHRRFLLRGFPGSQIECNTWEPNGEIDTAVRRFLNFLGRKESGAPDPDPNVTPGLRIRFHDPVFARFPINIAKRDPADARKLLVAPVLTGTPGLDQYVISDLVAPMNVANRTWHYFGDKNVEGVPFSVLGTKRKPLPADVIDNAAGVGFAQKVAWLYEPADQYTPIGMRNKKTGQVFRKLRGRH